MGRILEIGAIHIPYRYLHDWYLFANQEIVTLLSLSTAKILIFYVIFYAALAGFFAAIFAVFYQTLDPHQPKWKLSDGLIGNNPGLGFRPMPDESNVESTLIWFEAANKDNTKHWISALDEFLANYMNPPKDHKENVEKECSNDKLPSGGKVCPVDVSDRTFKGCTNSNDYGYSESSPCIFLKLNKVSVTLNFWVLSFANFHFQS